LAIRLELSLQVDEAFSAGVNGESSQVAHDPAAAQPLGHRSGGAGAAEEVGNQVALVGGGADDALQEGLGLLGGIVKSFTLRRY
jgi:hypothetical protein